MSTNVKYFSDMSFEKEVIEASKTMPVLVDFYADWCGPCRMIAPMIEELADEFTGKVIVGKLNTDQNPNTSMRFNITGIPTLIIFKNGQIFNQIVGVRPKPVLSQILLDAIKNS